MTSNAVFCRQQATTQRAAAAEATLDNVRERCERAASSWEAMAARAEQVEKLRTDREAQATRLVEAAAVR